MLFTMLLVCLTSPGPALFRQKRLGKDGKLFDVFKIRTMYVDAEKLSGPVLCQPGDSRITPMGKILRFLHLDELPQLINVIRGEMCLVGPRPERPEIIARHGLNELVPSFVERTKVLPGVTGLAQINLPPDQSADSVIPKVILDLEYINSANAGLDLRILMCTAMRMVGVRNGRAVRLFGLDRKVVLEELDASCKREAQWSDSMQQNRNGSQTAHAPAPALAMVAASASGKATFANAAVWDRVEVESRCDN
jgi:lipopolysaccharide/colanic/teichoic acid biosynthesis glycosyltransferase